MTGPEYVDPKELRPGPIRHESLPPALLEYIEAVYHMIGPYLHTTLEQFEIGFMRDAHPAREVAVWCGITAAWSDYHNKYLGGQLLTDAEETKLFGALAAMSAGVTEAAELGVPEEVGHRLLECYDELEEE